MCVCQVCIFHYPYRQKCPLLKTEQRCSARLLVRELNKEFSDSAQSTAKWERRASRSSQSSSPFAELAGSVWKAVQPDEDQESQQDTNSTHTDSNPVRKPRSERKRGASHSAEALVEESIGQQLLNRKRNKCLQPLPSSEAPLFPGQALESPSNWSEPRTRSKEKEHPRSAAKDSYSPSSSGTEVAAVTQERKRHKGKRAEPSRATTEFRSKPGRKSLRKPSEENSPLRNQPAHRHKKGCGSAKSKGKERRGRPESAQEQSGRQK